MPRNQTSDDRPEIPPGTLDLLVLQCVTDAPQHGYAIARRIKARSGGTLLAEEGSLYPALHRLVRNKQLSAEWGTSENNRRARFYRITAAGRKRLEAGASAWRLVSAAVTAVLDGRDLRPNAGSAAWAV
ncbi:MAG: PadR family transcriptional regulator [Proteobacteria bacterium]|jgi:PadR family transcriptional regulator PadR|nr:PadR family transcriptional regulator [Pseudomonadota bacterium]